MCLCGNHDHAVLYEPYNFNVGAERRPTGPGRCSRTNPIGVRNRRWEFLGKLSIRAVFDEKLLVHGSPRRPVNEYLFADDVYTNPSKLMANFERMEQVACFVGHTHVPGVFMDDPYFESPDELTEPGRYEIAEDDRVIINVGSVGQPRDRDPRAAYAVVDDGVVEFVRLEYDVDSVVQKILAVPELDDFLAHRLLDGR